MSKLKGLIKNISPFNNRREMPVILLIIKAVIIFYFVKFGSELIGEGFAILVHLVCGKNPLNGEMFDANTILLITYYGYSLMIVIVLLYWKLFQKKKLSDIGLGRNFGTYFAGTVLGTVLIVLSVLAILLTGSIRYNGIFSSIDKTYILLMLGGFVFQGALEELLCRGLVLHILKDRTPAPVAVGVNSILFVIAHLSNMDGASPLIAVVAVVNLVLISVLCSLLTLRFKSLWAACGLHTIWNFILFNIFGLNLSGNDEMTAAVFNMSSVGNNVLNGDVYGIEASIVTAIVLISAIGICCALFRKDLRSSKIVSGT